MTKKELQMSMSDLLKLILIESDVDYGKFVLKLKLSGNNNFLNVTVNKESLSSYLKGDFGDIMLHISSNDSLSNSAYTLKLLKETKVNEIMNTTSEFRYLIEYVYPIYKRSSKIEEFLL